VAVATLVVLIGVVGVVIFVRTPTFSQLLKGWVDDYLPANFVGGISVGRVEVSLWGDLLLDGVTIADNAGEILTIPQVTVRYSVLPLIWHSIPLEVRVDDLRVHLREDADGQWNLVKALAAKTPPSPSKYSVYLNEISLRHGFIDVQRASAAGGAKYLLSEVNLSGSAAILTDRINAELAIQSCRIHAPKMPAAVISGHVTYMGGSQGTTIVAQNIGLATEKSAIEASATAENFGAKGLSAKILIRRLAREDVLAVVPSLPLHGSDVNGEIDMSGRSNNFNSHLALTFGQAHILGNASLRFNSQPFTYDVDASVENFDTAMISVGSNSFNGTVDATIKGSGTGSDIAKFNGELVLKGHDLSAARQPIGTLAATLRASNSIVTAHGDARGPSGNAVLDGRVDFTSSTASSNPSFRLSLKAQHLNIARLLAVKTISRTDLNFNSTVDGTGLRLDTLQSRLSFTSSRSTLGTFELQRVRIEAAMAKQQISISTAQLNAAGVFLTLRGRIGVANPFTTFVDYQIKAGRLNQVLKLANLIGDGDLVMNGRVRGVATGKNGVDLRVTGTAGSNELNVQQISAHAFSSHYDLAGVGRGIPSGTIVIKAEQLRGKVDLRNVSLNAEIARSKFPNIALTASAEDTKGDRDSLVTNLVFRNDRIDGTLTQATIALGQKQWELRGATRFWKDTRGEGVHQLEMRSGESSLAIDGSVAWSGAQNLEITANSIDLGLISALVPNSADLAGTVSAKATIGGTAAAPQLDCKASADKIAVNETHVGDLSLTGGYRDSDATINASFLQDAQHSATLKGTLPMTLQWAKGVTIGFRDRMALRFNAPGLRAAPLGAIAPRTLRGVTGQIVADLAVSGTPFKPIVDGKVGLNGGTVEILPLGVKVKDIEFAVALSTSILRIDHLSASAADGKLVGRGALALTNYAPGDMKLALQFSRGPAINTSRYKASADGTVSATGTLDAPRVKGKIEIRDATIRPDLAFLSGTSKLTPDDTIEVIRPEDEARRAQPLPQLSAAKSGASSVPSFNELDLNVAISIHRNSWIRQDDATAELVGDLQIKKKPGEQALIVGTIRTVRGWLRFQGRQFDLASGTISFTGGHTIDPSLDIDAQYKLPSYTVDVLVGGTASRPTLKLTSSPALEQADILALILFGKTTSSLGSGQRQDLQQSATQMASGAAAAAVGNAVGQALGLEGLGVELNDASSGGTGIGFGRYIGQNTYVSVSQAVGGEQGHQASVQYNITDWLSITSTSYSDGSAQVMLGFTKQY
jgi:autotransporter translocation and assembly factor TamB